MDISSFPALAGAFSSLTEIVKTILQMNKDAALNEKIIELQNVIMTTQSQVFSVHANYAELSKIKDEIEKKLVQYENWAETESQYQLKKLERGAFIYVPKGHDEPIHWLCANCYQNKVKSLLQYKTSVIGGHHYYCPNCNMTLFTREPIETYFHKDA